jgi:guanylate kinase
MTSVETQGDRRGLMLVISSPSGAGKTSLCRRLVNEFPGLSLSVSTTTRPPREQERDGVEYRFVDDADFDERVAQGAFLEWAEVHEHRYGTPRAAVAQSLERGEDVLFDIDWQGARSIRAQAPTDTVGVFTLPPSMAELARRLRSRAQDQEAVIARRLAGAKVEIRRWAEYDYVIVNRDLECAYAELARIYLAERARRARNLWIEPFVRRLLDEEV